MLWTDNPASKISANLAKKKNRIWHCLRKFQEQTAKPARTDWLKHGQILLQLARFSFRLKSLTSLLMASFALRYDLPEHANLMGP